MSSFTPELQEKMRDNIRSFMKLHNIDYQEIADQMGIQKQSLHNLLSKGTLSEKKARQLSEVLNYPYAMLIAGQPFLRETTLDEVVRRLERIERLLNITPEQ